MAMFKPFSSVFTEELIDLLDHRGVSNELVEMWSELEESRLAATSGGRSSSSQSTPSQPEHITRKLREAGLRYMRHLTDLSGLPLGGWFSAVLLFDIYQMREGPVSPEKLPGLCTAIVHTHRKTESVNPRSQDLCKEANHLVMWLRSQGYDAQQELTVETLLEQELDFLRVLDWDVQQPSIYNWTSTICERLNLVSSGKVSASVDYMFQLALRIAQRLLLRSPTQGELTPQRLVTGLVALGLVAARLFPLEDLCPAGVNATEWMDLFTRSLQLGAPSCALPLERRRQMLEVLMLATGRQADDIRSDAYAVAVEAAQAAAASSPAPVPSLPAGLAGSASAPQSAADAQARQAPGQPQDAIHLGHQLCGLVLSSSLRETTSSATAAAA